MLYPVFAHQSISTFQRKHYILVGRGTTALWLALRTLVRRDGPGEVIVPDMLCSTVLDGVLLAGCLPVFAEVSFDRFTLSPESIARLITPRTRAILVAHVFGYGADIAAIRRAAPGIPLIEDAVQGLGGHCQGQRLGSLGDLSFISFDSTKMIGGRGGLLMFDDDSLLDGIESDVRLLPDLPDLPSLSPVAILHQMLPPVAAAAYASQLRTLAPTLLRPFDPSPANVNRILADWETLDQRVLTRNARARFLHHAVPGLPEVREGDAIWRYTFAAPTPAIARWILRRLQQAGFNGTGLYYPLSRLFDQHTQSGILANRMVNLWVDDTVSETDLRRTARIVRAAPSIPFSQYFT